MGLLWRRRGPYGLAGRLRTSTHCPKHKLSGRTLNIFHYGCIESESDTQVSPMFNFYSKRCMITEQVLFTIAFRVCSLRS